MARRRGVAAPGARSAGRHPDGEPVTEWWHRAGAYLVDRLLLLVITYAIVGTTVDTLGVAAAIALSAVAVLAYGIGFLGQWQATPGKLLVGLRVRRYDVAGPMSLRTVTVRWVVTVGPSLVVGAAVVPAALLVSTLWVAADCLWPLWDPRRQALHDKAAGTVVVRRRG